MKLVLLLIWPVAALARRLEKEKNYLNMYLKKLGFIEGDNYGTLNDTVCIKY